ncbi:hypothetical protein SDRG_00952 [Saprolegnia diclina VS20]|uniref:Ribosome biogenesis protein WDR12 homolog n=1 Tax=Saprolegnia diclina (strain VS20) TaxID=1156394 RepID=T0R585_SAPDV|nr:hypothetical protein SDRG_00952 [Saprolegnia diclina VS20]EQC42111.1 hypothetical protein SDRG_00952 [Saprolegnia diclina VS20]|eukprot:XP_008604680.1 hypothetical protein SDRG_00952 [Saprolegnia diclina VS20]
MQDEGAQIRVKFVTKNPEIRVTETPFAVPIKLARAGLSQVVNHLLNTAEPKPFDFLIDDNFLRTSLEKYVVQHNLNDEAVLELEYVEAHLEPEAKSSQNHPDWISAVATSGAFVATGCYDGVLRVFTLAGAPVAQAKAHDSVIKTVAMHGDLIVTGSKDQTLKTWKLSGNTLTAISVGVGHLNSVDTVAIDAEAEFVLSGSWDNTVRVWSATADETDTSTKKQKTAKGTKTSLVTAEATLVLPGHTASVVAVAFHPTESHAAYSAAMDRSIKLWDLSLQMCKQTMSGSSTISDMSVNKDGMVLTAHPDTAIRLWDPRAAKAGTTLVQKTFQSHKMWVSAVEWASETQFVSAGYDGTVKVWDSRSSIPLFTLAAHTGKALDVAWIAADKPAFVSGGEDCQLKFYGTAP